MTAKTYRLRTKTTDSAPAGAILLDALDGDAANLVSGWKPAADSPTTGAASDLLWLATGALAADSLSPRAETPDGWTRDIRLTMNISDQTAWSGRETDADQVLRFLTGDNWAVDFVRRPPRPLRVPASEGSFDGVCLLSGGLDSLIGAIDLLEDDPERRLLLLGVEDSTISAGRQTRLYDALAEAYPERVSLRQSWLILRKPNDRQDHSLAATRERTTRSRSILFIASALACAAALGPEVPVYVPENGLIGINVPLVPARAGSLSTRTTHPAFVSRLVNFGQSVGVGNPIINPLRFKTKGEAVTSCLNSTLLASTATTSISCAHPTAGRYTGTSGPCGYCYPCLIRRAALFQAGLDSGGDYGVDVLESETFLGSSSTKPASLRALISAVRRGSRPSDVLRNGPVPAGEVEKLASLHGRGLAELEVWLRSATAKAVLDALP